MVKINLISLKMRTDSQQVFQKPRPFANDVCPGSDPVAPSRPCPLQSICVAFRLSLSWRSVRQSGRIWNKNVFENRQVEPRVDIRRAYLTTSFVVNASPLARRSVSASPCSRHILLASSTARSTLCSRRRIQYRVIVTYFHSPGIQVKNSLHIDCI